MRGDTSADGPSPSEQAATLARLAHDARLVRMAVQDGHPAAKAAVDRLEQALEQAVDADTPPEAFAARAELEAVLGELQAAGIKVEAELSDMEVDGILGAMKMMVLTATLSAR